VTLSPCRQGPGADAGQPSTGAYGPSDGGTLVFDEFGTLKFNVHKRLTGRGQQQKMEYLWAHGGYRADRAELRTKAPGGYFANLHRQRAL